MSTDELLARLDFLADPVEDCTDAEIEQYCREAAALIRRLREALGTLLDAEKFDDDYPPLVEARATALALLA